MVIGIQDKQIFIKQRQKQKGLSQYEKISVKRFEKIINENGLHFKVNLSDYLDTGLFADRRLLRAKIREESAGKHVLNLFSYTGSFSVCAAAGGAKSTDSVDLSNTYLEWTRENFSLNKLTSSFTSFSSLRRSVLRRSVLCGSALHGSALHRCDAAVNNLIRADVLKFLEKAVATKNRWDIIILDPPAFSNSKKMEESFDLKRDITMLVNHCLYLLARGGKLYLSVNIKHSFDSNFFLDMSKSSRLSNLHITDLSEKMIDEDFKGRKIPKTLLFEM